jgi:hypothetical protein
MTSGIFCFGASLRFRRERKVIYHQTCSRASEKNGKTARHFPDGFSGL